MNKEVLAAVGLAKGQLKSSRAAMAVLEHPESLGRLSTGGSIPASIWDLCEVNDLLYEPGVLTGAFRFCDWGSYLFRPTRLIARLPGTESIICCGKLLLDDKGFYLAPWTGMCPTRHDIYAGTAGAKVENRDRRPLWPRSQILL